PAAAGQSLKQLQAAVKGPAIPPLGWPSVTVPGAMDGWRVLHERFGKLSMAELLAPAIGYARDGFPLSPVIADGWRRNVARFERGKADIGPAWDNLARTWMIDGQTPAAGRLFKNTDLARTLTNVAAFGRSWFYEGEGAAVIEAFMKRIGGPLRASDLAAYRAEWVEPISTKYRGHDVWQCPPNGQGVTVLQMLNILEGYDLKAMGFGSADALHVMVEAKKAAFRDRARLIADPRFAPFPSQLLDKAYAAQQRAKIVMDKAAPAADLAGQKDGDTIYLATGDASGMMVSFIQSNYRGMGSGLIPDGLGFGLNCRAALITRGLAEIGRLAATKGGNPLTLAGLAGVGDLVLTCTGSLSRNRTVGVELGKGRKLHEILEGLGHVAEGVETTKSAHDLGKKLAVELPITEEVYRVLYEDKPARQALVDLMNRPLKHEQA
ncbi:MAG: hypothetical protein EBZ50_09885, partial [Alphaproteobacteria bacterium]|nr:hypothetical protein [Alphaproteobacteria bacterium]